MSYIPTDIQSDTYLFNDHVPIALEQPATSNSIEYNISEWFQGSNHTVKCQNRGIKILLTWANFVVKKSLEEKNQSAGDFNYIKSLKDEIKYLRAENQIKIVIIRNMSEKEKLLIQCLHLIVAPILESSNGNPILNSPSKSFEVLSSEVLSNAIKITRKTPVIN